MTTALRRCFACSVLASAVLLLSLEAAAGPADAREAPSKLSPANDVFDVEQMDLKPLWRTDLGQVAEVRLENLHPAGHLLVAETPTGELHFVDARTGRWQTVRTFRHGLGCAPTVSGNTLFLVSRNRVYGFDAQTDMLSKGYHPQFAVSTPPVVFQDSLILAGGNGHLARVTVVGSKERWLRSIRGAIWEQPVLAEGKLFAASGEVICLRPEDATELWRWEPDSPSHLSTGVAVYQGSAYVGDNRGHLYARGTDYGDHRWKKTFDSPIVGKLEVVEGKLLVFTNKPAVTCLEAAGERKVLWEYPGGVRLLTSGEGTVYVLTDDGSIAALSLERGKVLWTDPLPDDCVVAGDPRRPVLYIGNAQGTIVAFEELN